MESPFEITRHKIEAALGIPALLLLLALLATVFIARASAADHAGLDYVTGGIGADELERLKVLEPKFNLKLVFTLVEGNYVSDVAVVVKDKSGNPVLVLFAPGPVVLARLPSGAYLVEATYGSALQSRKVDVRDSLRTEYMRWPSDPESDFPGPKATERE